MMRRLLAILSSIILAASAINATPALAKTKYAKTEIDKAVGKCVGTVLGGALLGALVGGKKNRAKGALIGAAAGGVVCAIIVKNAKRKQQILEAQRQTAMHNESYSTTFLDDEGNSVQYSGEIAETKTYDGSSLRPVKYRGIDGSKQRSPVLETGDTECRSVNSNLSYGETQSGGLPSQVFCRTAAGDWEPYSPQTA